MMTLSADIAVRQSDTSNAIFECIATTSDGEPITFGIELSGPVLTAIQRLKQRHTKEPWPVPTEWITSATSQYPSLEMDIRLLPAGDATCMVSCHVAGRPVVFESNRFLSLASQLPVPNIRPRGQMGCFYAMLTAGCYGPDELTGALNRAGKHHFVDIATLLLNHGAKIDSPDIKPEYRPFLLAVQRQMALEGMNEAAPQPGRLRL